jgi:hypothetical protein
VPFTRTPKDYAKLVGKLVQSSYCKDLSPDWHILYHIVGSEIIIFARSKKMPLLAISLEHLFGIL